VLNVARGGTLIQDINSQVSGAIKHEQGIPRDRPSHKVKLQLDSRLGNIAGTEEAVVNSHHHQAVANLGEDLMAVSWSSDGLVEAVEDTRRDRFVVAVQWHPELGWKEDQLSQRIFKAFVTEAQKRIDDDVRQAVSLSCAAKGTPTG